jgi:hypothetical protein
MSKQMTQFKQNGLIHNAPYCLRRSFAHKTAQFANSKETVQSFISFLATCRLKIGTNENMFRNLCDKSASITKKAADQKEKST